MEFNNKTILITGLVVASICAMFLNFEQIALAIVSGLVGYLSKDIVDGTSSSVAPKEVSVDTEDVSVVPKDVSIDTENVSVDDDEVA
jgi:hypothetical protein